MLHFICTYTDDPTKAGESNDDTCSLTESCACFAQWPAWLPVNITQRSAVETEWMQEREELVPTSASVFLPPSILCQLVQLCQLPKQYDILGISLNGTTHAKSHSCYLCFLLFLALQCLGWHRFLHTPCNFPRFIDRVWSMQHANNVDYIFGK